jgi:DNA-binding PadR family transcriptional regulator
MTELDYCILGVIWQEEPVSAYGVRSHFAQSPTAAWSSSTGTVYPAIRRLIRARLVRGEKRQGGRRMRLLSLTTKGEGTLRSWLVIVRPELGTATPDPIRTRSQFLGALPARERQRFLADAKQVTTAALSELKEIQKRRGTGEPSPGEHWSTEGAVFELEARLRWLDFAAARQRPAGRSRARRPTPKGRG